MILKQAHSVLYYGSIMFDNGIVVLNGFTGALSLDDVVYLPTNRRRASRHEVT